MNPRDEFLRTFFEKILGTPRIVEKVSRLKNTSDGVIEKETQITGLHGGAFRTAHIKEHGTLACGCTAVPAIQCQILDDLFPGPHLACSDHAFFCTVCHLGRCKHHGEEHDGQWVCKLCAEDNRPFRIFGQILRSIGGILE